MTENRDNLVQIPDQIMHVAGAGVNGLQALRSLVDQQPVTAYEVKWGEAFGRAVIDDLASVEGAAPRAELNYSPAVVVGELLARTGLDPLDLKVLTDSLPLMFRRKSLSPLDVYVYSLFVEIYHHHALRQPK